MKLIIGVILIWLGGIALTLAIILPIVEGQTKISLNTQVSPLPAIVVQSWATCAAPCSGLMLATVQVNGVSGSYFVIPSGPTTASQWVPQSVVIQGGTSVSCQQVKP